MWLAYVKQVAFLLRVLACHIPSLSKSFFALYIQVEDNYNGASMFLPFIFILLIVVIKIWNTVDNFFVDPCVASKFEDACRSALSADGHIRCG